jgi:PmbA protein
MSGGHGSKNLEAMAALACEAGIKGGADFADALASSSRTMSVPVEKNGIKAVMEHHKEHVSVRCFVGGGVGILSSPNLKEEEVRDAAERAVRMARVAEKDPDFVTLPSPEEHGRAAGLFDPELAGMSCARLVEMVAEEIESARNVDDRIAVVEGDAGFSVHNAMLANSAGIREDVSGTWLSLYTMTMVRKDEEVASAYEFDYARRLLDFKSEGVGAEAARKTIRQLGAENVQTGRFPVILGPLASETIFTSIVECANAEDVQRGRSFLASKKGKRIASKLVTLVDDGLIPGGMSSGAVDAEGSVRRQIEIVREGVLLGYLHSLYTSLKAKEDNTGHGSRSGWVSPTNVIPKLGSRAAEEIISEVKNGLYVDSGGFSPDLQTGEISATVDWGFWIENGEFAYPVKNAMVGGGAVELLMRIDAISSDYRAEPGAVMPTVRISEAAVAGLR